MVHISKNFRDEIDKCLKGKITSNNQIKARDNTPQILVDKGVKNLPMLITQKHVQSIIYSKQEALKLGLKIKNTNYHGLGKKLLIKTIAGLDDPQAIYQIDNNNYFIVTEYKDKQGRYIIVPIEIKSRGTYNNKYIEENQIKSVYGRNNLDRYIRNNNFKQIYKKEASTLNEGIQYSNISNNASLGKSIAFSKENVNTTI